MLKQRALIRLVFAKLTLNEGKRTWEYSKEFRVLSEAVNQTNCSKVENLDGFEKEIFEHQELPDNPTNKNALCLKRPIWLPREDNSLCSYENEPARNARKLAARRISLSTEKQKKCPSTKSCWPLFWLERWYDFRATDWATYLQYPEFTNKEVNRFLNL